MTLGFECVCVCCVRCSPYVCVQYGYFYFVVVVCEAFERDTLIAPTIRKKNDDVRLGSVCVCVRV